MRSPVPPWRPSTAGRVMLDTVNSPVGGRRLEEDETLELLLEDELEELAPFESDANVELEELSESNELDEANSLLCELTGEELEVPAADVEDRLGLLESLLPESELVDEGRSVGALLLELVEDSIGCSGCGPS